MILRSLKKLSGKSQIEKNPSQSCIRKICYNCSWMLNVNSNGYLYSIGGKVEQWYMDQSFWKWHWYVMTDERNSEMLWNRFKSYLKKSRRNLQHVL